MQPYLFPYVGYFNLIQASEQFVFYDDVNYIRRGWINRNKILNNGSEILFTVPLSCATPNRLIKDISHCIDDRWRNKFYNKLLHSYGKSPFFSSVVDVVMAPFDEPLSSVADIAIGSIASVYRYLDIPLKYTRSSVCSPQTQGMEKSDRLIDITQSLGFKELVNPSGGKTLYEKSYFRGKGVELSFIKTPLVAYPQHDKSFIPWLSIIDVLMFCSKDKVVELINQYELE